MRGRPSDTALRRRGKHVAEFGFGQLPPFRDLGDAGLRDENVPANFCREPLRICLHDLESRQPRGGERRHSVGADRRKLDLLRVDGLFQNAPPGAGFLRSAIEVELAAPLVEDHNLLQPRRRFARALEHIGALAHRIDAVVSHDAGEASDAEAFQGLVKAGRAQQIQTKVRQTQDIDIWRPASIINDRELKKISTAVGIDYDPKELEPNKIYLQVIQPGIVQLPPYSDNQWATGETSEILWSGNNLTIIAPPPSIIVAAKLVRAEDRDIDDSIYLIESKDIKTAQILNAISKIPDQHDRETARENFTLLRVIVEQKMPPIQALKKEPPQR